MGICLSLCYTVSYQAGCWCEAFLVIACCPCVQEEGLHGASVLTGWFKM